jgi:hypothetical protein
MSAPGYSIVYIHPKEEMERVRKDAMSRGNKKCAARLARLDELYEKWKLLSLESRQARIMWWGSE